MFSDPILVVIILSSLLVSAVLHEVMHGLTAYWLGDDTAKHMGRLTLNPLKHIDPFITILMPVMLALSGLPILAGAKPVPFDPNRVKGGDMGAALVGLAGPLTNLALALVVGGWMRFTMDGQIGTNVYEILNYFVLVNLGLFVFNMIPFPPLDGSRVLYSVAPEPVRSVMRQIEQFGIMGFALFFMLLYGGISEYIGEIIDAVYSFILG